MGTIQNVKATDSVYIQVYKVKHIRVLEESLGWANISFLYLFILPSMFRVS